MEGERTEPEKEKECWGKKHIYIFEKPWVGINIQTKLYEYTFQS